MNPKALKELNKMIKKKVKLMNTECCPYCHCCCPICGGYISISSEEDEEMDDLMVYESESSDEDFDTFELEI